MNIRRSTAAGRVLGIAGAMLAVVFATLVFQVPMAGSAMMTPSVPAAAQDSAAVTAAVEVFHGALARGDSAGALVLLAADVMILESGYAETRDEYRAHHLSADIEFARATSTTRTVSRVVVLGDAAWLTAASVTRGNYRGRDVNSRGVALMVLGRQSGAWKIRAVHWSSRRT